MNAVGVLGHIDDPAFAGRFRHTVEIGWGDAAKHRQIASADTGLVVRIQLSRGTFLSDGAVIADDGLQVVTVARPPEPAIVVDFADNPGGAGAHRLLMLGYLLGNQHAPIDVTEQVLAAPLFTSAGAAQAMLDDLGVVGRVGAVPLARDGWARTSGTHHDADHHGEH